MTNLPHFTAVPARAVFFDLDDTLCDAKLAFAQASQVAFASIRAQYPQFDEAQIREKWRFVHGPLFADLAAGHLSMSEVRTLRFRRLLAALSVCDNEFADETDFLLGRTQLDLITLFDDVTVLEELRNRGLHVGIITNGSGDAHPDSQRSKAEILGLLERVDSFWVSDEMGYRKPDPRAFLPALRVAGCAPNEAVFIGDSVENDVVGANRAGLVSVLLCRPVSALPHTEVDLPCHVVESLVEVIPLTGD